MLSPSAASFIIEGQTGEYKDDTSTIRISRSEGDVRIHLETPDNSISGTLLDASIDEFGDLSLIFPETQITIVTQREAMA